MGPAFAGTTSESFSHNRVTPMNFDFSDEQKQMRDEARKFLGEKCAPKAVRAVLDGKEPYDRELWKGLAEMGFSRRRDPRGIRRCGRGPSRTLRDRGGDGPGAGAGAVLFHRLSRGRGAAARRQRGPEAEMAAEDRNRRGDRHAGAVRGQGQSVTAGHQACRIRQHAERREEAGAGWRDRRSRDRRGAYRIERTRQ